MTKNRLAFSYLVFDYWLQCEVELKEDVSALFRTGRSKYCDTFL